MSSLLSCVSSLLMQLCIQPPQLYPAFFSCVLPSHAAVFSLCPAFSCSCVLLLSYVQLLSCVQIISCVQHLSCAQPSQLYVQPSHAAVSSLLNVGVQCPAYQQCIEIQVSCAESLKFTTHVNHVAIACHPPSKCSAFLWVETLMPCCFL